MREIKFRGYSVRFKENEWFYGDLIKYKEDEFYIVESNSGSWDILHDGILVDKNTIGQFTGLKDKNGVEIYEGDTEIEYGVIKDMMEFYLYICFNSILSEYLEVTKPL